MSHSYNLRINLNIVEALQFLKCFFRHDLVFREFLTTAAAEGIEGDDEDEPATWDELVELEDSDSSQ